MSRHLKHDTALELALALVAEVAPSVPDPAAQKRLLASLYDRLLTALDVYESKAAREWRRLARPSEN
jgi:hypothetical protein